MAGRLRGVGPRRVAHLPAHCKLAGNRRRRVEVIVPQHMHSEHVHHDRLYMGYGHHDAQIVMVLLTYSSFCRRPTCCCKRGRKRSPAVRMPLEASHRSGALLWQAELSELLLPGSQSALLISSRI